MAQFIVSEAAAQGGEKNRDNAGSSSQGRGETDKQSQNRQNYDAAADSEQATQRSREEATND